MWSPQNFQETIAERGFANTRSLLSREEIADLGDALERWLDQRRSDEQRHTAGLRIQLAGCACVSEAARASILLRHVESVLGPAARPVRAILFDKTAEANWKVAWHQDVTIAIREKRSAAGFSAWSEKDGVCHVQPPIEVLERMLTARIHLDDCDVENGPLRLFAGSHRAGRLDPQAIAGWRSTGKETVCTARRGDVLWMRPLLLHASSAAISPARRRVLHLEYASGSLPHGLRWHEELASPALT